MKKTLTIIFLITASLNAIAQDETWYTDVTANTQITEKYGTKMYAADVNGDDYEDLITIETKNNTEYFNDRQTLHLYLNVKNDTTGGRMFKDVSEESGIWSNVDPNDTGRRTTVIALADVDNDGDMDMVTAHYFHRFSSFNDIGDRAEVLLNDGNGFFTLKHNNGLHELGALNCQGLSFLDYDLDGNVDLFMGNWFVDYKALSNDEYMSDRLMRGNGDGTFTDVTEKVGINNPKETLYGSSCGDWNNDGWPDIFTAPYCRTNGALYMNNGDGTFTDKAQEAGYNARAMPGDNGQALCMWGAYPMDYDNDEDLDFFFSLVHGGLASNEGRSTIVVNSGKDNDYKLSWDRSLLNHNIAPRPTHMAEYEASWFDLDNDGLTDLLHGQGSYTATKGRLYLFKQNPDHSFTPIVKQMVLGKNDYRTPNRIRTFDYDLDGDMDMLFSGGDNNFLHLLKNDIGDKNNSISIKLGGKTGVNRLGVGAKIKVYANGMVMTKEVNAGYGNASGQDGFIQIFGLGSSTKVDSVVVLWPNKEHSRTAYYDLAANELHKLGAFVESPSKDALVIYPNPMVKGSTRIHAPNHFDYKKTFTIHNSMGDFIKEIEVNSPTDPSLEMYLAPGIYFVTCEDSLGNEAKGKLIVN